MRCEICHSPHAAVWTEVKAFVHYRCNACRYIFVSPKPTEPDLVNYYQNADFYQKAEDEESRLMKEAGDRLRRLSKFADRFGLRKSLLDVGCASGIFLEQGKRNGWEVEGIEASAALAAKAGAKGLNVREGWFHGPPGQKRYSIVTSWDVLEHAPDPVEFLAGLRSCVPKGGLVALSTPLSSGLPAKLLGSKFPMIYPPLHLSLFSRKAILILGTHLGLQTVSFRSFSSLKVENLRRGLFRFVFHANGIPDRMGRRFSSLAAFVILPGSQLMDRMGIGSQMEIVFRRIR